MAFSFDNIVNRIKQQFKPKTFFNVETGEIIKSKEYKKLDEEQKKLYIKETALPREQVSTPIIDTNGYKPKGTEEVKSSRVESTEEDLTSGRIYRPKVRQRKPRGKDKKPRKKRESKSKEAKENKTKPNKPKTKTSENKKKTYKDVKPPAPPKDITKEFEKNMEQPLPIIDNIQALKTEIVNLERKTYPVYDLSGTRSYLLGIVEDMEAYYEGTSDYSNYLKENEDEIAELLWEIQYESKDQEKIDTAITQLATLLNMGTLSPMQQDKLDYIHDNYGWSDTNG